MPLHEARPWFPKQTDKQWRDIQLQLLSCTGPLTNMWADMVADAKQQAEQENTSQQEELEALAIPAPAVVEMIQRTLVLMGSIHMNKNQRQWVSILEAIDKDFGSYATAEANTSQGKLLFGQDFTEALQREKVKANSLLQPKHMGHIWAAYGPHMGTWFATYVSGHSRKEALAPKHCFEIRAFKGLTYLKTIPAYHRNKKKWIRSCIHMPADVPRGLTAVGPFVVELWLSLWTLLTPSRQKAADSSSRAVISDVAGGLRSYFQRGFLVRRGSERGARCRRQT